VAVPGQAARRPDSHDSSTLLRRCVHMCASVCAWVCVAHACYLLSWRTYPLLL
jgi:hypothetical protein